MVTVYADTPSITLHVRQMRIVPALGFDPAILVYVGLHHWTLSPLQMNLKQYKSRDSGLERI